MISDVFHLAVKVNAKRETQQISSVMPLMMGWTPASLSTRVSIIGIVSIGPITVVIVPIASTAVRVISMLSIIIPKLISSIELTIGPILVVLRPILHHWWTVGTILRHLHVFFIFVGVPVSEELIEFGQVFGIFLLCFCCRHLERANGVKICHLFQFSLILDERVTRVSRQVTSAINEREKKEHEPKKAWKERIHFWLQCQISDGESRRSMQQPYYWNRHAEYHPKHRLLKYSKSSKISRETLQILSKLRKTYSKLPPMVYSLRKMDEQEGREAICSSNRCVLCMVIEEITLDYDIFGQPCRISSKNTQALWRPTSFYVCDRIYQQIKDDLLRSRLDHDSLPLCLFPIYIDLPDRKSIAKGKGSEELFLPSTVPSNQNDLILLQERFHMMLYKEEALEIGLCPVRRRLYDDLFDELIRIIILQCSERGLLLARVKNEYVHWMNTYEEIYSSGMAYGLRQYLYKTEEKQNEEQIVRQLETDCEQLREELERESVRFERFSRLIANRQTDDDEEQTNEQRLMKNNVNILRSANEILRRDLQNTLNQILSSTIFLGDPIDYSRETN